MMIGSTDGIYATTHALLGGGVDTPAVILVVILHAGIKRRITFPSKMEMSLVKS
jgi:hypothetical protein